VVTRSQELRRTAPALSAAIPIVIIFLAVLGIVLTAAKPEALGLSESRTSSWIAALYGVSAIPSLALSIRYRQPMLLTGNVFAIIFFVSLAHEISFPELVGASMVAGVIVLVAAAFGLTGLIAAWIPAPIVHGLIAGAVMPFVVRIFSSMSTSANGESISWEVPAMVGSAVVAYLLSQRSIDPRIPPILPAFVAGVAAAGVTGQLGPLPTSFALPDLTIVGPELSVAAIVTATPVLVALITLQSNLPSVIYMRGQGYDPPERVLNLVSGVGTMVGSLLGPTAVSLALPLVPLAAGPTAGDPSIRYRSVFVPAAALLLISLFAGVAADVAVLIPPTLLLTLAGLALVGALAGALREITRGPLVLGPLFAFAIALSDMSLFGLGPFFWSLVLGTGVSVVLERDGWKQR
jgi:benzoate membrane transport protein